MVNKKKINTEAVAPTDELFDDPFVTYGNPTARDHLGETSRRLLALKDTPREKNQLDQVCQELQEQQRQRSILIKSRNMQMNRLQAIVAGQIGYSSSMKEEERRKRFAEGGDLIKEIMEEVDNGRKHPFILSGIVSQTMIGIRAFEELRDGIEKQMLKLAKELPVFEWIQHPRRRGFGAMFLCVVIGETGNLENYTNPGKVWRRLACAPWTFGLDKDGEPLTLMGATWRSKRYGELPKEQWELYGYSPRRRSISYLIGEGIVKQNGDGPYRATYERKKAQALADPEKSRCVTCKGAGKNSRGAKCTPCKGTGKTALRAHRHGMLCATKELLRDIWAKWNGEDIE